MLNSPLKYVDPDGESVATLLPILFRSVIFFGDFINNVINGYDNPAAMAWNNMNNVTNGMNSIFQIPIYKNGNTDVSVGIMPLNLNAGLNISHQSGSNTFSFSGGYGIGGGYAGGGYNYSKGEWSYGVGVGAGKNVIGAGFDIRKNGYGGGYVFTHYGGAISPDANNKIGMQQNVGGVNFYFDDFSFSLQNDFLAGSGDKGRSNAIEFNYKDLSIGTHLFTNNRTGKPEFGKDLHYDRKGIRLGKWKNGQVYSSPLYLGIRYDNQVARIGYSHKMFQHGTQNFVHKKGFPLLTYRNVGFQNYFLGYNDFYTGMYYYSGWNNPYSIWGR